MSEIDAKVNMSLDEIIKMEKKEKKKKPGTANGKAGVKRNRGGSSGVRGRSGFRGRGARVKRNVGNSGVLKKDQTWQRNQNGNVRGAFVKKRFNRSGNLVRSRSNLALNQKNTTRGGVTARRARGNRFGLSRVRNRANLNFNQSGVFVNNKASLRRTNSLPNLRDPTSVHNRLGYQSPAQIAYRNRVKRAKQLLLQRQNQRLSLQNQFRANAMMAQTAKSPLTVQRPLERRQQIITSQRRFTTGALRSDQIARAQRHAQYEQKLMRITSARPANPVNFMCTMGSDYAPTLRQRSPSLSRNRAGGSMNNLMFGVPRRQAMQSLNMMGRPRSRSRSRSRTRNTPSSDPTGANDRLFSEVMYSLSRDFGVTRQTLNDRFSS